MASSKFVSRGGDKLQSAIKNWSAKGGLKIENLTVLDVGSSTGGFVDCLLQNGVKRVYAVDTCYGELAWKLRNDPRVVVMERTNILHLEHLSPVIPAKAGIHTNKTWIPDKQSLRPVGLQVRDDNGDKADLITIDAGWTKLELVLPVVKKFLKPDGIIIALLKPHYEAPKKDLVKGVLSPEKAEEIKNQVVERVKGLGFRVENIMESPILGGAGNKEYLLLISSFSQRKLDK